MGKGKEERKEMKKRKRKEVTYLVAWWLALGREKMSEK
jgi:hypothetical protein